MRRFKVERVNSAADYGYDTIIVTLPNPPYENENILNKTGWKEKDCTITEITMYRGEE